MKAIHFILICKNCEKEVQIIYERKELKEMLKTSKTGQIIDIFGQCPICQRVNTFSITRQDIKTAIQKINRTPTNSNHPVLICKISQQEIR
jgi:phage FluMu protein Com